MPGNEARVSHESSCPLGQTVPLNASYEERNRGHSCTCFDWQEQEPIVVEFAPGVIGAVRHMDVHYGKRVDHIWIHNWAFAVKGSLDWFNSFVLCRLSEYGWIHFVGWDGTVESVMPFHKPLPKPHPIPNCDWVRGNGPFEFCRSDLRHEGDHDWYEPPLKVQEPTWTCKGCGWETWGGTDYDPCNGIGGHEESPLGYPI